MKFEDIITGLKNKCLFLSALNSTEPCKTHGRKKKYDDLLRDLAKILVDSHFHLLFLNHAYIQI